PTDRDMWQSLIGELNLHTLPDGTAIGLALANAAARLKESPAKSRLIVLVTDGDNNVVHVYPDSAAAICAGLGIKVYTVAVGTQKGAVIIPIPVRDRSTG